MKKRSRVAGSAPHGYWLGILSVLAVIPLLAGCGAEEPKQAAEPVTPAEEFSPPAEEFSAPLWAGTAYALGAPFLSTQPKRVALSTPQLLI